MKSQDKLTFEELISIFGLDLRKCANGWSGACPIHGGDNPSAFKFYENNVWQCFSHNCHAEYGGRIFGFIKGMLSQDHPVTNEETQEWIDQHGNIDAPYRVFRIQRGFDTLKPIADRKLLNEQLSIPSTYYQKRGFSKFILKKFMVGDCWNKGRKMYGRAVVPIFDDSYRWVLGCSGRAINEFKPKWLHSNFSKSNVLYNYWFAKNEVRRTKTLILTEGPAKVWRLEEAGFGNAMATFGTSMQLNQLKKIAQLGVKKVVIAMDGDPPGEKAAKELAKKLGSLYTIKIAEWDIVDIDETDKEIVSQKMKEVLRQ